MAFNALKPAQAERLALLAEELGEALQIVCKTLRHGYESYNPDDEDAGDNRAQLEKEIGDVSYAVRLLFSAEDIDEAFIVQAAHEAATKKPDYLHHQPHKLLAKLKERAIANALSESAPT